MKLIASAYWRIAFLKSREANAAWACSPYALKRLQSRVQCSSLAASRSCCAIWQSTATAAAFAVQSNVAYGPARFAPRLACAAGGLLGDKLGSRAKTAAAAASKAPINAPI